jgi:hypothetical protein
MQESIASLQVEADRKDSKKVKLGFVLAHNRGNDKCKHKGPSFGRSIPLLKVLLKSSRHYSLNNTLWIFTLQHFSIDIKTMIPTIKEFFT